MSKKQLIILGMAIAGLGIGTLIGLQQIQKTDVSMAQNGQQEIVAEDIFESGAIQAIAQSKLPNKVLPEETINCFAKKWGVTPEVQEFVASNGETYFLLISPKSSAENVEKAKNRINEKIAREQLITEKFERTPAEREPAVGQIKNLIGDSRGITYLSVSGDPNLEGEKGVETYKDDKGYVYEYDIDAKKIMTMQVAGGKTWCDANQDALTSDCKFKEGQITEQQAKEKALAALTAELGKEKAQEVLNNSSVERVPEKGNTFVSFYPKDAGSSYQLLIVIEPVKGEIINYQNYLQ